MDPQQLAAYLFIKYSDTISDDSVAAQKAIRAAATFMFELRQFENDLMLGDYGIVVDRLKDAR